MENYDDNKIVITNDDGEQVECEILFTYKHEPTGKNYVVLYPVSQAEDDSVEEMDLYAYSFIENEAGEGELFALEEDEFEFMQDVIDQFYKDQEEIDD